VGTDALVVEQASTRVISAGRKGPFVVTSDAVETKDAVVCRATLRDEGLERDVASAQFRIRAL